LISILLNQGKYSECLTHAEQLEASVETELIDGPIACSLYSIKSRSHLMMGDFKEAYEIGVKGVEKIREQFGNKGRQLAVGYFRLGWICQYICSISKTNPELLLSSEALDKSKLEGEALVYLTNAMDIGNGILSKMKAKNIEDSQLEVIVQQSNQLISAV
jgi:hypothetical protein